jgi:DNA topoisomerase-1
MSSRTVCNPCMDADDSDEARDNVACAVRIGLRYVQVGEPGYSRRKQGRGFCYRDPKGRTVPRGPVRERLEQLAIPPAWTNVWICAHADGHIQATGRDEAGRKQYIYHPRWSEERSRAKFEQLVTLGHELPNLRASVDAALEQEGLGRERVLAAVVRLLETTLARVGNDDYAEHNGSFGLTTLRKRHVNESRDGLSLCFPGKSGVQWDVDIEDERVVAVIHECLEIPGPRLFKYVDEEGRTHELGAADVNDYLREVAHPDLTAKAFRTWAGTVLATKALWEIEREEPETRLKAKVAKAVRTVAEQLGNTPAVCRKSYVHPAVIEAYAAGELPPEPDPAEHTGEDGLEPEEQQVLAFLEDQLEGSGGAMR